MMRVISWLAAGTALAGALPAAAQTTPAPPPTLPTPPSQSDISRARVGLPPPETPSYDLRIQSPERAAVPKAVESIEFTVHRITVEGATVFPQAEVDALFAPLLDHPVRLEAVRDAANRLEARYRAHGYFLTRVFVPPQELANDTLTVRVIEGYVDKIDVTGLAPGADARAARVLAPITADHPVALPTVERQLLILNDIPGVTATGILRPGASVGATNLAVELERPRDTIQAAISNTNSRILGPWVYALSGTLNRPAGLPGALNLAATASGPGFGASQSVSGRYNVALGDDGLVASVGAIYAEAHPKASLKPLNIDNTLLSISARARYPLIRGRRNSLFLEGGFALSRARTDVLSQRLIHDNESVIDLGLLYQQVDVLGGSTTATVSVLHGLTIFDASKRSEPIPSVLGFDPTFTRVTASLQRVQRLAPQLSLLLYAQGQYTGDKLLTGELIAFGGPVLGRGYDPSTLIGDKGIGGLAELRYDIAVNRKWLGNVQLYGFVDAASATSLRTRFAPRNTDHISSGGLGVRLSQRYGAIDLQVADAFRHVAVTDARHDPRFLVSLIINN